MVPSIRKKDWKPDKPTNSQQPTNTTINNTD
jgi:hypothetical protein